VEALIVPPIINMADEHPQPTVKKFKDFFNHLKKVFGLGSHPADLTITTNPKEAAKLKAKYTHFRILVIGRANAGKTTLLKRVCNTKEDPVYNKVRYQLRFITIPHSYCPFTNRLTRPPRYHLCPF
jgi:ribosome biogenesis GTPase A